MNNIIQVKYECFDEPYCEISNICKQLQEKEQEYEELKGDLWSKEENLKDYIEHFNKASDELDRLKERLKRAKQRIVKLNKMRKAKEQECEELKEKYLELKEQNGSYIVQLNTVNEQLDQLKEQLKRKEKEYEELKEGIMPFMNGDYCVNVCRVKQQFNQLKAEVELLRQYKGSKQASYESMQTEWNKAVSQNQDLLKQNEQWQKKYELLMIKGKEGISKRDWAYEQRKKKYDQLKAKLIEIKEIAQSNMDCKQFMAIQCMLTGSTDDKNKVLEQILQKISEVIPNEN
jgi:chromosome segregation ATPase